jgi:hypothetical protein
MKTEWTPGQWKHYYAHKRHDQSIQRAQDALNAKIEAFSANAPQCADPSKGWTDEGTAAHNAHVVAVMTVARKRGVLNGTQTALEKSMERMTAAKEKAAWDQLRSACAAEEEAIAAFLAAGKTLDSAKAAASKHRPGEWEWEAEIRVKAEVAPQIKAWEAARAALRTAREAVKAADLAAYEASRLYRIHEEQFAHEAHRAAAASR